jgi:hypothetical protein
MGIDDIESVTLATAVNSVGEGDGDVSRCDIHCWILICRQGDLYLIVENETREGGGESEARVPLGRRREEVGAGRREEEKVRGLGGEKINDKFNR